MVWGVKTVCNKCVYVCGTSLHSGIITQTACRKVHRMRRRRRRKSVPI